MACPDLCTAEKCAELEGRIGNLEQALELLKAAFDVHVVQNIPEAHNYIPTVTVETFINENNTLTIEVTIDEQKDFSQTTLPTHQKSNLSLNGSYQSEILTLTVADGESQDSIEITIPLPVPEIPETEECNLNINGSYLDEVITITYNYCDQTNSFQIPIPISNKITNIINNNNYGGGNGDLNCPNIETKIDDCCAEILSAINSLQTNVISEIFNSENILSNQINNTESKLTNDIQTVNDAVCIDITGTTSGEYSCEFEVDEEGNTIPTYAVSKVKDKSYQGKGFLGIHEILKLIHENLTYLHSDVCKAVDPLHTIKLEDIYNFCDNSGIKRSDYQDGTQGDAEYDQAIKDYLQQLLINSKYGYLIDQLTEQNPTNLITAPNNWTNFILTDFALIQSRINREAICEIEIPETPDTVTIVASEKELHRVEGKQLIIQFVTLNNYPKRSRDSSYRPIQIPAAKETYDWVTNFEDLRWQQGNQYAELVLEGWKHGVSGWFANVDAADAFFDAVLNLTTAIEVNRLYPVHKTPKTNIPIRETRPWRAFITEVNNQGNPTTLTKYFPPQNN